MLRLNEKPLQEYPWYVRGIFWLQKKKYGTVLASAKLWGRSPRLFLALSSFFGALERKFSPLSPQLRALLCTHVASIVRCPFCTDINSALFLKRQGKKEELQSLEHFDTSPLFSEKEKAALKFATAMSLTPNGVTDQIYADLKKHFSEEEIIELTALVAFQNCSSRFNTALNVPSQHFLQAQ